MKKLLLAGVLISGSTAFGQVLNETFESVTAPALPAGWTTTNAAAPAGIFETGTSADANAGGYWPVPTHGQFAMANDDVCNCNMSAVYLTTPTLNLTGMSGMALSYDVVDDGSYGGVPHTVELSVNGGSTWSTIYTHTFPGSVTWESNLVALGAAADNQANVKLRFKYNDDAAWATGLAIDNVVVQALPALEVELSSVSLARYAAMNTNSILGMSVTNLGASTITSLQVNWNDGTDHIQTINGLNIASGQTANVNHPTAVNYATAVEKNINVTIVQANGAADGNAADNTGSAKHNTVSQIAPKKVVIEEGTGTWCGWCPRGAVAMDYMATTYPNDFIGIAVHNGDPMTVTAYDNGANFGGFPSCNVDRVMLDQNVSSTAFENYYNARINNIIPAQVLATVSGTAPNLTVTVNATFYTPFAAANYRLGAIVAENDVTGTTSGYNQTNYYSGGGSGAMGGFESLPDPVPAAQMVYDHVGRALLGGYNGQASSVPAAITDGQVVTYTFNYTVPTTSTVADMYVVPVLIDQATGEIFTSGETPLQAAGISELEALNLTVYPNPASDVMNIVFDAQNADYDVKVVDLQGRVVMARSYSNLAGKQMISVPVADLATGSYMVAITTGGLTKTVNVVVE